MSFVSENIQTLHININSIFGEVVYTEALEQFVGEYTKQIDLSNFSKGVYIIKITTDLGVVNKKIVLQ